MGCCDSSTELRGNRRFFHAGGRAVAVGSSDSVQRGATRAKALGSVARSVTKWLVLALLRFYQAFLSPFLGGACKFYPSCSNYAYEAVVRHGTKRGTILALQRLGRCRPFTKGGFDPGSRESHRDRVLPSVPGDCWRAQ